MKSQPKQPELTASYDPAVDVLYVLTNPNVESEGDGRPCGIELDFAIKDGTPCGVTVLGFKRNGWLQNFDRFFGIVSDHLRVSVDDVRLAVMKALAAT